MKGKEARLRLVKEEIDRMTCPPDRRDRLVFDSDLPGFAVRVTRDGSKVFLYQYRVGAVLRRLRLGRYGDLTPAQARKLAREASGKVAAGADPVAERSAARETAAVAAEDRRRQQAADAFTFGKMIDQWEEMQLAHRSGSYRREAPRALRYSLAELLSEPASKLDTLTIQRAVDAMSQRSSLRLSDQPSPAGAPVKNRGKQPSAMPAQRGEAMKRRVRAYGTAAFTWAIKRGLVSANPFASVVVETREVIRDRALTDAELAEVWRATADLGWPWDKFFRVLLLTLQREAEVAGMAWAELSADGKVWELPATRTKNRKAHIVHLAEPVRSILAAVPRVPGSPLIFTTTGRTPVSGFSHAKARLDAAVAKRRAEQAAQEGRKPEPMQAWRLHDFRRTGVTAMARLGIQIAVADKVLNHTQGAIRGVMAVYQRHDFLVEREAALRVWAAHVLAVSEGSGTGAKVVELRRG